MFSHTSLICLVEALRVEEGAATEEV